MTTPRHTLHLGRLRVSVPVDAEFTDLFAVVDGVELEEFDLGDDSAEAGYLGWMQVSEDARETSGFDEVEVDERCWVALFGESDPRVIALQQQRDRALVLGASTTKHEDAVARVHDLRKRYALAPPTPAESFGLALGFLELPPDRPEELTATLTCGKAWTLSVSTCAVAVASPSNYETVAANVLAVSEPARQPHVEFTTRTLGSLAGEELFMEIVGEKLHAYQAIWRDPGRVDDSGHPEVELTLALRGLTLEAARDEWLRVIESLRLATEYGAP